MHKTERRNRNRRGKILIVTTIGNNRKIEICQVWQECILHLYLAGFVCDTNEIGLRDSHTRIRQIILLILPNVTLHDSFPLVYETSLLLTFKRFHAHNPNNRVIELSAVPPSNKLCARLFSCLVERNLRVSASVNYLNGDKSMNWKKNRQVEGEESLVLIVEFARIFHLVERIVL